MDSDIRKWLSEAAKKYDAPQQPSALPPAKAGHTKPAARRSRRFSRMWLVAGIAVLIVTVGISIFMLMRDEATVQQTSIVPSSISRRVSFPVFYPDPKKIPNGYKIEEKSFSATKQAVVYAVNYGDGKKVAFTIQPAPSEDNLKMFYTNKLPLHNELTTPVGPGVIGALENQTFASVVAETNTWVIARAPLDIPQSQLKQLLLSLTK